MFWILFQAFKNLQILLLRLLLLHSEFVIMFCDVSIRDFTDDVKLLFVEYYKPFLTISKCYIRDY